MANLVVTSTTNTIKVVFNDTPADGITQGAWRKDKVISFRLHDTYIDVITMGIDFQVSHTATAGCLIIDSVDGVAPSSLSDLYNKLTALLG
jgi:hypothetical protein